MTKKNSAEFPFIYFFYGIIFGNILEKIWQVFHGHSPHSQLCCSTCKFILLIFVALCKGKLTGFPTVSDFLPKELLQQRINRPKRNFLILCAKFGYFHKAVQHLKLLYPLAISLGTPVQLLV